MSAVAMERGLGWRIDAGAWLRRSGAACLAVTLVGQLMLAGYATVVYGGRALRGEPARWNEILRHAWVEGDPWLNAVFALHLLFATAILFGGVLQLIPPLRRALPALHRWNGRAYLVSAVAMSVAGFVYLWTRAGTGDVSQKLGLSCDAGLILAFAALAWRQARRGDVAAHRRWALRLFFAVSAAWVFRVALMLWIVVNGGPAGFDAKTFTGPALTFLAFAQFLFPLAVLEGYLRAQRSRAAWPRLAMTGVLAACTVAVVAGSGAAAMALWLPHL